MAAAQRASTIVCKYHSVTQLVDFYKRGIRGRGQKRKAVLMNLDLKKFRPRSIGETPESLANWLADSRPAWNQLIATLRIKRQSKKQKQAK